MTVISMTLLRQIDCLDGVVVDVADVTGYTVERDGAGVDVGGFAGVIVVALAVAVGGGREERKERVLYVSAVGDRGIEKPLSDLGGVV